MRHLAALAMLLAGSTSPVFAQSIVGAWRAVEFNETAGPDSGRHAADVQPVLLLFTPTYYSAQGVSTYRPRPMLTPSSPDSLRLRVFRSYVANAGTYQLKDSVLTYTPVVALSPAVMSGRTFTFTVRVLGDTMWTSQRQGQTNIVTGKWVRVQ